MAMSTTLFAVTPTLLRSLEAAPDTITELKAERTFDTYLSMTLPFFLSEKPDEASDEDDADDEEEEDADDAADASEDSDDDDDDGHAHPLAPVLIGTRSVTCNRLENGAFHVVPVDVVQELASLLANVDVAGLTSAVLEADLEDIADGEVWEELEQLDLTEPKQVAKALLKDLKGLTAFYAAAAKDGSAVVLYTG
jgi:hypothetical protein